MASKWPLDAAQTKVFIILAKRNSPLFSRVSLSILRDVCSYLGDFLLAARMSSFSLKIADLGRGRMQRMSFGREIVSGSVLCMIRSSVLLIAGGNRPVGIEMTFDLETQLTSAVQPMKTGREWPGIVPYHEFAYMFGGNPNRTMLASCEKFHIKEQHWTNCPDMHTPKCCFTPCVYLQEIYLASSDQQEKHVEVFTPATEQYRLLLLRLSSRSFGSVSFIIKDELYILNYDKKAYKWRLNSAKSAPLKFSCNIRPMHALCNGTVIRHREFIYWANYTGSVLSYDWANNVLQVLSNRV